MSKTFFKIWHGKFYFTDRTFMTLSEVYAEIPFNPDIKRLCLRLLNKNGKPLLKTYRSDYRNNEQKILEALAQERANNEKEIHSSDT